MHYITYFRRNTRLGIIKYRREVKVGDKIVVSNTIKDIVWVLLK